MHPYDRTSDPVPSNAFPENNGRATALETALHLYSLRIPVVPLYGPHEPDGSNGKRPRGGRDWGTKVWTPKLLVAHYRLHPDDNLGILEGDFFDLMTTDPDGPEAETTLRELFGGPVPPTRGWSSERAGALGRHCFRHDPRLLALARGTGIIELPGVALRVGGGAKQLQSACPPSRSSTGFVREWNGIEFIDRLPAAFFGRLEALLVRPDDAPRPTPGKPATPVLRVVGGADIETRVVAYLAACDPAISGAHGHDQAFGVACRVGPGFDLHPEDAYRYLRDHYNPRCQPPWSEKEMRHKVDDAYAKETRRGWLKDAERTPRAHRPAANPGERLASASRAERLAALGVTEAHTVTPTNVRWLWPGKVSARHMTLVGGPGGVGKSQSQAAIVASFTAGVPLPDGTMPLATGTVIILSAEDDAEDTVTPRLIAAGADLAKVKFVSAMETITAKDGTKTIHPRSFQDHDYWNRLLAEFPDAILIVADTLPTYLGRGVNDHKNIDVKNALEPFIAAVLKPHDLALVGVVHTGKAQDYRRAVDMILGSVAYGNTARCVWIVLEDPEQPGRFLFAWAKSNNYPPQDAIAYAIVAKEIEHDGGEVLRTSALEWEKKPVKLSANEIVDATRAAGREKRGPQRTTRRVAWDFIVGQLQAENDQPGVEIVKAWLDAGHKETPFWDARRDLIAAGALVVDDSRSPKIWHISDNIPEYPE